VLLEIVLFAGRGGVLKHEYFNYGYKVLYDCHFFIIIKFSVP